jgi:hypothetical protein
VAWPVERGGTDDAIAKEGITPFTEVQIAYRIVGLCQVGVLVMQ